LSKWIPGVHYSGSLETDASKGGLRKRISQMNQYRVVFLLLLIVITAMTSYALLAETVYAEDITLTADVRVENEASCEAIDGSWGNASCTLSSSDRVTVSYGVTLTVAKDVTLRNEGGTVRNDGAIENDGKFDNSREGFFLFGTVSNYGTLINHGILLNRGAPDRGAAMITNGELGTIYNDKGGVVENYGDIIDGALENLGILHNTTNGFIGGWAPWEGELVSSGVISNAGAISVADMVNTGTLRNEATGTVSTWGSPLGGGWLLNDGDIANDGRFEVSGNMCCPGRIYNNGNFENNGSVRGYSRLHNAGTFVNECLAAVQVYVITGAPWVQLPCPSENYFPLVVR
jgi:hypothetical protein